jgi:hypothetical protein
VPFDDSLMLPLDNTPVADNPDRKFFYQREHALLKKYMSEAGVTALPGTLDEYVTKVATPTLERQRRAGAVAVKFEAAYLRSLDFGESRTDEAAGVYARYTKGGVPSKVENLEVQNALFRAIAREAGRLGMPVHIHTGTGCGGYFDLMGSNPGLLNSILSDASLRKTKFVLIHGVRAHTRKWRRFCSESQTCTRTSLSRTRSFLPAPWLLCCGIGSRPSRRK